MKSHFLGNTDLQVTQLGYGSMGLRGPNTWGVRVVEDADADRFLNRVLDAGINFIDTAPDYGVAEERIGRYLKHRRQEFMLATKCGCAYVQHADHLEIHHEFTEAVVRRNLETSLRRLQTETIDLLQFHGGEASALQRDGLIELLREFQKQGLVRYIGVSSSNPNLRKMIDLEAFDCFQVPYSCVEPEHDELIKEAGEIGGGIIVRGGIGKGGPDAEIQRDAVNTVWQSAKLHELLEHDMKPAELILRFTLSHPYCHTTIVGTCNSHHLEENLAAAERGPLPPNLVAEIKQRVASVT